MDVGISLSQKVASITAPFTSINPDNNIYNLIIKSGKMCTCYF